MGRPKDFPNIYQDLLTKYKAKGIADKEYKEYLLLAREQGLSKEARLDDISGLSHSEQTRQVKSNVKKEKPDSSGPLLKKQRVSGALVSLAEKELYERLVEAECKRAEAEKARGDDLHEIAMALASGKKEDLVIPPSPAVDEEPAAGAGNIEATPVLNTHREERTKQKHDKLRTLAGVAAGAGGSASKSQSKQKGGGVF